MARILVIDDENGVRSMLTRLLTHHGHSVRSEPNGKHISEVMEEFAPDLVITDIIMPETDGLETINRLREEYPQVRIIAISGGGLQVSMDHLPMARMLGAELTLSKPIDNEKLLQAVEIVTSD
ncbi:MAG: response regulator [bacterium]|nr:response regulator [bacterium]